MSASAAIEATTNSASSSTSSSGSGSELMCPPPPTQHQHFDPIDHKPPSFTLQPPPHQIDQKPHPFLLDQSQQQKGNSNYAASVDQKPFFVDQQKTGFSQSDMSTNMLPPTCYIPGTNSAAPYFYPSASGSGYDFYNPSQAQQFLYQPASSPESRFYRVHASIDFTSRLSILIFLLELFLNFTIRFYFCKVHFHISLLKLGKDISYPNNRLN